MHRTKKLLEHMITLMFSSRIGVLKIWLFIFKILFDFLFYQFNYRANWLQTTFTYENLYKRLFQKHKK